MSCPICATVSKSKFTGIEGAEPLVMAGFALGLFTERLAKAMDCPDIRVESTLCDAHWKSLQEAVNHCASILPSEYAKHFKLEREL